MTLTFNFIFYNINDFYFSGIFKKAVRDTFVQKNPTVNYLHLEKARNITNMDPYAIPYKMTTKTFTIVTKTLEI